MQAVELNREGVWSYVLRAYLTTISTDKSFCSQEAEVQAKQSDRALRTRTSTPRLNDPFAMKAR